MDGQWILDGLGTCLKVLAWPIYDGLLTAVESITAALDVSSLGLQFAAGLSSLPGPLRYILSAICLAQGMTIIAGAIALRMLINLIPATFTRV